MIFMLNFMSGVLAMTGFVLITAYMIINDINSFVAAVISTFWLVSCVIAASFLSQKLKGKWHE